MCAVPLLVVPPGCRLCNSCSELRVRALHCAIAGRRCFRPGMTPSPSVSLFARDHTLPLLLPPPLSLPLPDTRRGKGKV